MFRLHDWASTSLGPVSAWPQCLRSAVQLTLPSHAQIVMFLGADFVAVYNDAYAPTIGIKHPHAFGRPAKESWGELWSDLEPLLQRVLKTGETVSATDRPFYIERHGYPETVFFDISYSPIRDEDGIVHGVLCIVRETTERLRVAEIDARLAAIVDSSDDAIISKDLDSRIVSWNQGAERMFGYSAQETIGQSILALIPERLHAEEVDIINRIRAGQRVQSYETLRMRKDGTPIDVSLTISPLKAADGRIVGASTIARDITSTKEYARHVKLLMREINHRVKNEYAVILAMVKETSRRTATPEEFERDVRDRIQSLSRSHDLLVSSRWTGASLADLVREHLKPFGHEDQITIEGPPLTLNSRVVQYVGMAIHELGTNSAKYGALSGDGGKLRVSWSIAADAAGVAELHLSWSESTGSTEQVQRNPRRGFGTIVLERATPSAVSGTATLTREPGKVMWELKAPLDAILVQQDDDEDAAPLPDILSKVE